MFNLETEYAVDDLTDAKRLIEKGWIKGKFKKEPLLWGEPKYCLLGAMNEVNANSLAYKNLYKALMALNWNSPVRFNDHIKTKKEDVLKMFDAAIQLASKEVDNPIENA